MQGKKIYQEKLFVNFQLSNVIPENNFYRVLSETIDLNFLYNSTKDYYGDCGQKGLDPVVFMKFMLIGYLEGINSDRKLIEHCSMRLDLLFFLGYDIDESLPWHSTISRTRQRLPETVFEQLFERIFILCVNQGLVSGHTQSVDSALIKANASLENFVPKQPLISIRKYLDEVKTQDEFSEEIQDIKKTKNKSRSNSKRNKTHISKTDPDSKMAFKPGKKMDLYYYSQMSVDSQNNIISCIQSQKADSRDNTYLIENVLSAKKLIEKSGLVMQNVLADTNYSSAENYNKLDKLKLKAFIPPHGQFKGMPIGFSYNNQDDLWICPNGNKLTLKREYIRENRELKSYRISSNICNKCNNSSCYLKDKKVRAMDISKYYFKIKEAQNRINSKQGKYMNKIRKTTVEPTFGTLMENYAMRRVRVRGISMVNKVFVLSATAYNLKKYMIYIQKKYNIAAKRLRNVGITNKSLCYILNKSYNF